jgi:hypothetical protein
MAVLPVGIGSAEEGGYQIERSLRFNSADSAYLDRTPASASNRKTWTWSGWVKRAGIGGAGFNEANIFAAFSGDFNNQTDLTWLTGNAFTFAVDVGGNREIGANSVAVFRDPSAWYHIVLSFDSTQATNSNGVRLYVNGVQQTLTFSAYTQNTDSQMNNTSTQRIGGRYSTSPYYPNMYLAEVHQIDGSALTPTSFGEFNSDTGVWQPKAYTGSYGTNGFYLDFADNTSTTTLGYDAAGSNDWTLNNFSVTAGAGNDSLVDSPTRYGTDTGAGGTVRGNYATWNPLINGDSAANGNLDVTNDTARSTQALLQFDTYWEITSTGGTTTAGTVSGTGTTNTTTIADTKTYGFRLTAAGTLDYINITDGGSFTNITTGLTGQQFIYASAASATTGSLNTGQRPFAATAPSGFKALVTTNLPTPTIEDGGDYMNVVLYTGNNSSTGTVRNLSGLNFQPDFVWIKNRQNTYWHNLYDSVRGAGSSKNLSSNTTNAEGNSANLYGYVSAFNSDGFEVTNGSDATDPGIWVNQNLETFVAWNWKANGAGVSNTDGTITSTVSANTDSGFSVVTYTGTGSNATVGHGLGVAPKMVIVKNRNVADRGWVVWHTGLSAASKVLILNSTAAEDTATAAFQATIPTSSVVYLGTDSWTNNSSDTYVAYCFAPVAGYSAFGSYTGNGDANGPMIFTGFRPRWIMTRSTSGSREWYIYDAARDTYNVAKTYLRANTSAAEGSFDSYDMLSNGFKLRSSDTAFNGSGETYVYACFAESPFKYSLAR